MQISDIKLNESNPRVISREKLEKLQKSIKDFPKMMSLRPIVIDNNGVILGGNMRYQALVALGYKQIPDTWVKVADQLNEEEKKRFSFLCFIFLPIEIFPSVVRLLSVFYIYLFVKKILQKGVCQAFVEDFYIASFHNNGRKSHSLYLE